MYILSNAWTEKGERTRKRTRDQVVVMGWLVSNRPIGVSAGLSLAVIVAVKPVFHTSHVIPNNPTDIYRIGKALLLSISRITWANFPGLSDQTNLLNAVENPQAIDAATRATTQPQPFQGPEWTKRIHRRH
ncbi:hypothetical protein M747DRAFT_303267 [Aspergillus niger ATCC 13496]|uniref:Uncharacterized protein n=1 Tax=Aspergillus niger ATCC 13496 TaxID=1353008 RepID=A0A370C4K5_ASPNG|nr:hypothetical protein M747DRAFT_303267 [Aspergillus niger ATCC 13496]